ncbi:MAG: helix-hairpin-helix domain-containing protein, partial [Chloroflexota bacterium]|nr:helix-hairpin-helix domain-containing protein [Chloroflexota bacterium]
ELLQQIPPGAWQLLSVRGLGACTVGRIVRDLGVSDLDSLRAAGSDGRLSQLPGIGSRKVAQILAEIERIASTRGLFSLGHALAAAHLEAARLGNIDGVSAVRLAGAARRACETMSGVDLVVAVRDPSRPALAALGGESLVQLDPDELREPIPVRIRVSAEESLGSALVLATGSDEHVARLTDLARRRGIELDSPQSVFGTEAELYRAVDLDLIPAELREGRDEIELARRGQLPRLLEHRDLGCDLHAHSDWSDGQDSIAVMAEAAHRAGLRQLVISDHSQSLAVANGLSPERVAAQRDEIAAQARQWGELSLLHGTESEIRVDGSLDFEPELLAGLDWVVASVHAGLGQSRSAMTERILTAISNPATCAIGHPTGRIVLGREGFDFDHDVVFAAAAETGVALEINSQPGRLDLSSDLARRAARAGAVLTVNSDAHAAAQLANTQLGVMIARRAGLTCAQVINAWEWEQIAERRARRLAGA